MRSVAIPPSTYEPEGDVVTQHECPGCRCADRAEADALAQLLDRDDGLRSPTGNCWGVADGLDGFFVHTEACPNVGVGWTGGSTCVGLRNWRGSNQPWMLHRAVAPW